MNGLHKALAQAIVDNPKPLIHGEFHFLRIELNVSQKALRARLGVSEQTIARYEKSEYIIPRTTDAALRSLHMESLPKNNPASHFLGLRADNQAQKEVKAISLKLQEVNEYWEVAA